MMRARSIALTGAAILFCPATGASAADKRAVIAKNLVAAATAAEAGNCRKALDAIGKVRKAKEFPSLPDELRMGTLHLAAFCESQGGQSAAAYRDAFAASAFAASDESVWRMRLAYELEDKRHDAAVATIEAMTQGHGAALNAIPIRWLYQLSSALKREQAIAARRRLLATLSDDSYQPDEPGVTNGGFREAYAGVLHDAGDVKGALRLIKEITEPSQIIDLSLDQRFRGAFPTDPDIRAAAERRLSESRVLVEQHPDRIGPVTDVSRYLRALARPKEALVALDAIRPLVERGAAVDHDESAVWWWDERSRAYAMLGDYPRAIEALRAGGELQEDGALNVSQVINLALKQLAFGDAEGALRTISVFDQAGRTVSPYGAMLVARARGCGLVQTGKANAAAKDVTFVRANTADAPGVLTEMLLCVGDQEGAAASLIAQLDDADQRVSALRELSTFDPPLVDPPVNSVSRGYDALKKRGDVQAAIARAGGVRRFNVQDVPL